MAKSEIAMSDSEISASLSDLDPRGKDGGDDGKQEPRGKAETDPGDDIEYVGPEAEAGEGGEGKKPPKDAKPKGDADPNKKPADKGKPDPDKPPDGFVPHKALHAEREERKRVEQALATSKREWEAKFNTILSELTKASQERRAPAQSEPEIDLGPDPAVDPIGAAIWLREQRAADLRRQREWEARQAEQNKTQEAQKKEWEAFTNDLAASNRDWEETITHFPEMNQVLDGLRESFKREFVALGWHGPQLIQKLNELEAQHAVYARRSGKHIGEYVAQLAAARGVQMPQRQAPSNGDDGDDEKPNGKGDGAAEIERLAKAQDAAENLSAAGGGAPGNTKMSFDSFDRMSQKEIEAWVRSTLKKGGQQAVDKALARMTGAGR